MKYKNAVELFKTKGTHLTMANYVSLAGTERRAANIVNKDKNINESIKHETGCNILTREHCRFVGRDNICHVVQMRYEYGSPNATDITGELLAMLHH